MNDMTSPQTAAPLALAGLTPVEVDTRLEELLGELQRIEQRIARTYSRAFTVLRLGLPRRGPIPSYRGEEAVAQLRAVASDESKQAMTRRNAAETLEEYEGLAARRGELEGKLEAINDEYLARGRWSRFFLVTSSQGHVHASMSCSTCRPTTTYQLLADLSGQSEEAAVAEFGSILCSACYPSAPVEWTAGRPGRSGR